MLASFDSIGSMMRINSSMGNERMRSTRWPRIAFLPLVPVTSVWYAYEGQSAFLCQRRADDFHTSPFLIIFVYRRKPHYSRGPFLTSSA